MFDNRLTGELLTFGVPFVAWQVWRLASGRPAAPALDMPAAARWSAWMFVTGVLLVTLGVVHLREERETQMDRAEDLLREGQFQAALASLDAAERWPSSSGDGDLLRGRIYARMGDDGRAEELFLRAYREDPDDFWPVAVLAEFYAARGPADVRRARSAPYVDRLRRDFAGNEAYPRVIERIERNLSTGN
jgi:tetratricopeptide (TPR) repeat protein